VRQLNDPGRIWVAPPSEINLRQLNEMLCLGKDNDANQTNFGVIFGDENNLAQYNLAFAISSCPTIEYIPGCESFTLRPGCSCSSQTLNCPGIPEVPCPPELMPEFQLDP